MAKQIDNRVVEMEFKNKDFEKAVAVTMKSLEELNKKLDSLNDINMSGFEQMAHSMNNTNFDRLADSIDYIKSRFGLIGIAAQDIKEEIVSNMIQAASSIGNVFERIEGTIAEKGKSRATNLAQAKFQLKGLGIAWNNVSESIDMAVNDTRFGLDEAAMAASQLAASGVKLGDDMTHALLGISGVAAMTNSEYSDMAHIFTTVAGTGKLYTQQLNMIASRGLNAAAAIAKYMTKMKGSLVTEADIRAMLSSKDDFIDFHTFAEAMWDQYGEQAKKGNDLFTGAFANAKAALGRIGEKFYTPFYEYARQTLVAVKPVINDLNAALTPFFTSLSGAMENTKDVAVTVLGEIHKAFAGEDGEDYFIKIFGKTIDIKKELGEIIDWVSSLLDGIAATLNGSNGVMSVAGDSLLNIFYNIYSVIKLIGEAIFETFGAPTKGDIIYLLQTFQDWTNSLRLSDEKIEDIKDTLSGILSIVHIILKTADAIFRVFIQPILRNLGWIDDSVLSLTGDIGNIFSAIDENYNPFDPLFTAFAKFRAHISPALSAFDKLKEVLSSTFKNVTGINSVEDLLNNIGDTLNKLHLENIVGGVFYGIAEAINFAGEHFNAFASLVEGNSTFKEYIHDLAEQSIVLSWVRDTITKIKTTIGDLLHGNITLSQALGLDKLAEKFKWLNPILEKFKEHYKSIFEVDPDSGKAPVNGFLDSFKNGLKESLKNLDFEDVFGAIGAGFYAYWMKKKAEIAEKIAGSVNTFTEAFQNLTEGINLSLVKMSKETNAEKILKIASAVALLAGSMFLLSRVNSDDLMKAIGALAAIMAMLTIATAVIAKVTALTKKTKSDSHTINTNVKTKDKSRSVGKGRKKKTTNNIFSFIGLQVTDIKESITETIKDMAGVPAMILSFGAAVGLIVLALYKLTSVVNATSTDNFMDALAAVMGIMGMVFLLTFFMEETLAYNQSKYKEFDASALDNISKMILAFGVATALISNSLLKFALIPEDKMVQVFNTAGLLALLMIAMGIVGAALTEFAAKSKDENVMLKAGGMMLMMGAAIALMTIPLASIAAVAAMGGKIWQAFFIVALLMAEMGAFVIAFSLLTGEINGSTAGMLAGGAAMILMAVAINMMIAPITAICALSAMKADVVGALSVLGAMIGVMALLNVLFGIIGAGSGGLGAVGMVAGAASMILMAVALQQLLIPLAAIAALQATGSFWAAFGGLAAGLGLLAAAALIAIPLAPGLITISNAVLAFGLTVLAIGGGLFLAASAVLQFISALFLIQAIDTEALATNMQGLGAAIIKGFVGALQAGRPAIVQGTMMLIGLFCETFAGSAGMISETTIILLTDVIVTIDKNAKSLGFHLGHALSDILFYALLGVAGSITDLIDKAFGGKGEFSKQLVETFMPDENSVGGKIFNFFSGDKNKKEAKEGAEEIGEEAGNTVVDSTVETLNSSENQGKMKDGASELADNFGSSLENTDISQFTEKFSEQGVEGFMSPLDIQGTESGTGVDLANYFGDSFTKTLDGKQDAAYDSGYNFTSKVKEGAQDGQKSHSPSKIAMKLAEYFGGAYVNELALFSKDAYNAGFNLSDSVVSGTENGAKGFGSKSLSALASVMANINTLGLDSDYQPTITPIVDLSGVNSGLDLINNLFGSSKTSLALAGDVTNLHDANRMLNFQIQNDNNTQAINSLGARIDRLGDAIMNTQMVMDTGTVVGVMANPMDRELGRRAIQVKRGGARR